MSWFPESDLFDVSMDEGPHEDFLQTPPSPCSDHQQQSLHVKLDVFQNPSTPVWTTQTPHGLGLLTLPVTNAPSTVTTAMDVSPHLHTTTAFVCPSDYTTSALSPDRVNPIRKESGSDRSCDPLSTILPGALWDHLRPTSPCAGGYNTSPGPSEYSRSSYPSAVSSPYAYSDSCYVHRSDSPQIKIEFATDHVIPHINFIGEDDELSHFDSPMDNDDLVVVKEERSIEERVIAFLGPSSRSETEDYKEPVHQTERRRAHSFGGTTNATFGSRRKRACIAPENAKYSCDKCGTRFQRAYNLKSHISNVHNRHRAKQHPCVYCAIKPFVRKTDLDRHIDSVHEKRRDHVCAMCGKDFPRKDTLTRHVNDGCPNRDKVRRRITKSRSNLSRL